MPTSTHRSIRFRISLLLLLSALNTIVMVALAVAALASGSQGPDLNTISQLAGISERLALVHEDALGGDRDAPIPLEELDARLTEVGRELAVFGEPGGEARSAFNSYHSALLIWDGDGRPRAGATYDAAQRSYRALLGSLYLMVPDAEHATVDQAVTYAPWVLAWVVMVALLTVWMSFQLRTLLSQPMARLASAASRVARGDLATAIPETGRGSAEIVEMGQAFEAMRSNLVELISKLDEQNLEMQTMLDALSDGVLFLDDRGRVMEFNPQAARLLEGYTDEGVLLAEGIALSAAFPRLPPSLFQQAQEQQVELPPPPGHPEDRTRHLTVRVYPVTQEKLGYRRVFVAVVRDVTEAVEVEKLKRDFLSVVTHELKTPLTAIDGFVRLLLVEKAGPLTEKQRKALTTVKSQSEVLGQMVQDLLDSTRLEGGNLTLSLAPVDPARLVRDAATSFRPSVEERGLALTVEVNSPEGARTLGDDFRLQQVLGNLVRNAIKFTAPGGDIRLVADVEGGHAILQVSDTGRGIPEEAMSRLFRKFYQVERGDKRVAGGTGLGLYICSQLTRAMGGTIDVRSTVGHGSTFTVRLPLIDAAGEQESG